MTILAHASIKRAIEVKNNRGKSKNGFVSNVKSHKRGRKINIAENQWYRFRANRTVYFHSYQSGREQLLAEQIRTEIEEERISERKGTSVIAP